MLALENVHASYGLSHVLQGISMVVWNKEIVCLLGRNGVGKTTTLKTIMGLLHPSSGKIEFLGKDLTKSFPNEISKMGIGYVPQGRRIFPNLTVLENLLLGMSNFGKIDKNLRNDKLEQVFNLFPVLKDRRNQMGSTLSGGEQQMLAIARALIGNNKLILLDEPSEALAPILAQQLFNTLKEIREMGITILLVEQNAKMALSIVDRGYIMEKGKIHFEGTSEEIINSKEAIEVLGIR
jgi:branched-chain amino acid transport system ATP-binding protein